MGASVLSLPSTVTAARPAAPFRLTFQKDRHPEDGYAAKTCQRPPGCCQEFTGMKPLEAQAGGAEEADPGCDMEAPNVPVHNGKNLVVASVAPSASDDFRI